VRNRPYIELLVGLSLLAALVVVFLGVRFFENMPLFSRSFTYETVFVQSGGLGPGSAVRMRGVDVGRVEVVRMNPGSSSVFVRFNVNRGVEVPEGTVVAVSGLSALGSISMELRPGSGPALPPGSRLASREPNDLVQNASDQLPRLLARMDTLLQVTTQFARRTDGLLYGPDAEVGQILEQLAHTTERLNAMLASEQPRVSRSLTNVEALTSDLSGFVRSQQDSTALLLSRLNSTLADAQNALNDVRRVSNSADSVLQRFERGEGTLGRFARDESLYERLDSTLMNANTLMEDFQTSPQRYLRHLRLFRLF